MLPVAPRTARRTFSAASASARAVTALVCAQSRSPRLMQSSATWASCAACSTCRAASSRSMLPWPISEIDIASHPPAPSYPGAPPLCRLDATYAGAGCVRVPRELRRLGEELQFGRHVSALPPVYTGGLSGGADRPVHVCVCVSVSAGPALPVTHLLGGWRGLPVPPRRPRVYLPLSSGDDKRPLATYARPH